MKKRFEGFKAGDKVTVIRAEQAYDGAGLITQNDTGKIKGFPPKVRIIKNTPFTDGLEFFAYVEFERTWNPPHNNPVRGGIDICNLKKL